MKTKFGNHTTSLEQRQYRLEKELAIELRHALKSEREGLYSRIYKRFFEEMQFDNSVWSSKESEHIVRLKKRVVHPLVNEGVNTFMEIGGGDHTFIQEMAKEINQLIAIEAHIPNTRQISRDNIKLIEVDMPPFPIDDNAIDVAFSSHFIEHLLPEDQVAHVAEMHRILRPEGSYVCITPNAIYGPHDISAKFGDSVATGLHLGELTYAALYRIFKRSGFKKIRSVWHIGEKPKISALLARIAVEKILQGFLALTKRQMNQSTLYLKRKPFRPLEQVIIIATK